MKNAVLEYDAINVRWLGYHTALKKFLEETAVLPNVASKEKDGYNKNVKVIYTNPSSAFTKYVIPMINGLSQYPIISFSLNSEETLSEVGNMISTFNLYRTFEDEAGKKRAERVSFNHPLIKELTYKCEIFTTKMSDCDYLMTLLECESNKFKPFSTVVNSRPAQFYIDNVETGNSEDYEGKKFIHATFTVKVPRAMIFPVEIEKDEAIIEHIYAYLLDDKKISINVVPEN